MGILNFFFGEDYRNDEVRELTIEYPSGNQFHVGTNKENANAHYASEEYEVVEDQPYTYHERGFFDWLFGG